MRALLLHLSHEGYESVVAETAKAWSCDILLYFPESLNHFYRFGIDKLGFFCIELIQFFFEEGNLKRVLNGRIGSVIR